MPEFSEQDMNYNLSTDGTLVSQGPQSVVPGMNLENSPLNLNKGPQSGGGQIGVRPLAQPVESGKPKVGRNDPCPCGSGKKYKKCHGS